jgi:hypothetical protein
MSRSRAGSFLSIALALAIAGCGDDNGVTTPIDPPPEVAGRYSGTWMLQVLRKSDGFQKAFECNTSVTLQQSGTSGSTAVISGQSVVYCVGKPVASYDILGVVTAGGAVTFVTDAPPPPEGPCPGGRGVSFSGRTTSSSDDRYRRLSARGVTNVTCPQFGEHQFTYILDAFRYRY